MIPIAKPLLDDNEADAVRRVIRTGWITQGPEVAAFEREFANAVGAPYACAVSNCTTALQLALQVAGVGPGDEVITVSHSFVATASSILHCGAKPVFVDITPDTYNMDPACVEAAITVSTKAILCVHQMGMPCDLSRLLEIAHAYHLPLVEDAACAIGSEILWNGRWERIGKPHGDVACFSFHPRKIVTMGDGGAITTRHEDWDARFRLMRQHGMSVPDTVRHASARVIFESYPEIGYNFRMTDVQAAIGREQLKRLDDMILHRRRMAEIYRELLDDLRGITLPVEPSWARSNWQSYCIRLAPEFDQLHVMQSMLDSGIATRRGIMCAHREGGYVNHPTAWRAADNLTQSEEAQDQCILLPLHHAVTGEDQAHIAAALRNALGVTA